MQNNAAKFIAISDAVKAEWIKKGIAEGKIIRIYNGIDSALYKPECKKRESILRLVIVGHIQLNKGQHQLIESIAKLPNEIKSNICLELLGEGYPDYIKLLMKRIKELNLENQVNLGGYKKDIPQILSSYDIGVTCSKSEGFGRISVEYMLAGLAVIASDTGANPEIVTDNIDGRIYRYGDAGHLAQVITDLYNDREELERLAANGRQKAESQFSITGCAGEVHALYQESLNESNYK
jgi:glycosyltransferase involved in cell wall biosynthesis